MSFLRCHSYSRLEREDPDDRKHRRAQFLIYKALEEADGRRRRRRSLRIMRLVIIPKFKSIKIGWHMKRVRKTMLSIFISI